MAEKFCRVVDKIDDVEEKLVGPLETINQLSDYHHSKKYKTYEASAMETVKKQITDNDRFSDGRYVVLVKEKKWKANGWCHNSGGATCQDGYYRSHRRDWQFSLEADVYKIDE